MPVRPLHQPKHCCVYSGTNPSSHLHRGENHEVSCHPSSKRPNHQTSISPRRLPFGSLIQTFLPALEHAANQAAIHYITQNLFHQSLTPVVLQRLLCGISKSSFRMRTMRMRNRLLSFSEEGRIVGSGMDQKCLDTEKGAKVLMRLEECAIASSRTLEVIRVG